MTKDNTRKRLLIIRNSLNSLSINQWNLKIENDLLRLPEYQNAKSILFYYPFGSEVDTLGMIKTSLKNGKITLLPRVIPEKKTIETCVVKDLEKDIIEGFSKIQEPKEICEKHNPAEIDLIVVPGLAFGEKGERLGYGKGYYDRFLKKTKGTILGICFERQITDKIILEKHDIRMDKILTEERIIDCKNTSQ